MEAVTKEVCHRVQTDINAFGVLFLARGGMLRSGRFAF